MPGRSDRRRQRTRTSILDAGQRLFATRAIEGVSIDDIVAAADVAKGSFYNHFDDKAGLARAITEFVQHDCNAHIDAANRAVADPASRVARALCVMIGYAARHPDRLLALLSLSERRSMADSPLNAGVVGDISDGLASGRFTGVTLESGLLVTMGIIHITVTHAMAERGGSAARALAATVGAALLRALGVDAGDASTAAHAAATDLL